MPNLAPVDLMILLIYFFFTVAIGIALRQFMTVGDDYLLAKRSLPGWLCGLAFAAAGLTSFEVLGMGAAGARYGLPAAGFFGLGSVIPLLFAALFLIPALYKSNARSLPGYLGMRFDEKTRAISAVFSLLGQLLMAALALYVMGHVSAALRLFTVAFHIERIGAQGLLALSIVVPAAIALLVVLMGGLGAAMYAQVMQFLVLVAGFAPMVFLSLRQVGGWSGMKTAYAAAMAQHGGAPAGAGALGTAVLLGILLTAGAACTDFSLLQNSLAAESLRASRRAPLIAAAARAFLPLLLVVPGVLAVTLPTPHTAITVRNDNGEIYHEIEVVPQAIDQGLGLVPTQTDSPADPMSGNVVKDAKGHAKFDYSMATPGMMPHNLPGGLLGLALAALLACLVNGLAGRIAACNNLFVYDVYQTWFRKDATAKHLLAVARWTTLGSVILASALAFGALHLHSMPGLLDLFAVSLAVLFAPLVGTFVLAALWKRATSYGAFAGLIGGVVAALLHWGIALPAGDARGIAGGWIAPLHHPAGPLRQNIGTALCAIVANVVLTAAVSLLMNSAAAEDAADASSPAELSRKRAKPLPWWKKPLGVAIVILLFAVAVSLIFV